MAALYCGSNFGRQSLSWQLEQLHPRQQKLMYLAHTLTNRNQCGQDITLKAHPHPEIHFQLDPAPTGTQPPKAAMSDDEQVFKTQAFGEHPTFKR